MTTGTCGNACITACSMFFCKVSTSWESCDAYQFKPISHTAAAAPDQYIALRHQPLAEAGRKSSCAKEIGRAHVGTPDTNAHIVCRLLLETTYENQLYQSTSHKITKTT